MTTSRFLICAALTLCACGPTYSIQQSSMVVLPTAPPPAAASGAAALDLGASVSADPLGSPGSGGTSGIAVPRAQPEGAISVRLADFVALRAWGAVALPQGRTQVSGTLEAPEEAAWLGAVGPVFRLREPTGLVFGELGVALGFAAIPSVLFVTERDCFEGEAPCTEFSYTQRQREIMPIFAVRADFGMGLAEWFRFRAGATVRNQPINEAAFERGTVPGSSVSAGPIGVVFHGGLEVDFADEVGLRAEVALPVLNLGLPYGPVFTLALQGRLDGDLDSPLGLEI